MDELIARMASFYLDNTSPLENDTVDSARAGAPPGAVAAASPQQNHIASPQPLTNGEVSPRPQRSLDATSNQAQAPTSSSSLGLTSTTNTSPSQTPTPPERFPLTHANLALHTHYMASQPRTRIHDYTHRTYLYALADHNQVFTFRWCCCSCGGMNAVQLVRSHVLHAEASSARGREIWVPSFLGRICGRRRGERNGEVGCVHMACLRCWFLEVRRVDLRP
jgi:hypothetical protein